VALHRGLVLAAVLAAAPGCYAYRPAPPTPNPDATVRIVLVGPSTLTTLSPAVKHEAVLEAAGRVTAVGGDTLAIRLGELRTGAGVIPGLSGQVALIPRNAILSIQERRFQGGLTFLAGLGALGIAATILTVVLIGAIIRAAAL